ncbi:MAG: S8 family peptidase [Ignavibacteria bacterium]|jgi:subtilisin family serine protease|nr:S8 family peptidase [Ignavibacteria bacterium]
MKKYLLFLLFVCIETYAFSNPKLSFETLTYLTSGNNSTKPSVCTFQSGDGVEYAKVFVKVDATYSKELLQPLGAREVIKTKTIALVSVPKDKILALSNLDCIKAVEVAIVPKPTLDRALVATNVDKVQAGIELQSKYTGKGVIVGVVDWGFDFTHPMFSDSDGKCRIKRAWVTNDNSGTPPVGYDLGTLYTDSDYIKNVKLYATDSNGHATHVLGICGGSPIEGKSGITYSGMAPSADLAIVDLSGASNGSHFDYIGTTVFEGVYYLIQYADSMNKPLVVNLSIGWENYNHCGDGKSLDELAFSEVLQEHSKGRIVVESAGNEAGANKHFLTEFNENDSASAKVAFESYRTGYNFASVAFVGEEHSSFTIDFTVGNSLTKTRSPLFTIATDAQEYLEDTNTYTLTFADTLERAYKVVAQCYKQYVSNGKPFYVITISVPNIDNKYDTLLFTIHSSNNSIHCWNNAGSRFFNQSSNVKPDAKYTLSLAGTVEEIITVGAYVTRGGGGGILNDICSFSSRGPTTDGRIKPDIAAPGAMIISANNTFYKGYPIVDSTKDGKFAFASIQGTSMSSPMVAGVVALMLEKNAELTQSEIKGILAVTAINDDYTKDARNNKSTTWGWGKIDAYAIMKVMEGSGIEDKNDFDFSVFPNPAVDMLNIKIDNVADLPYILSIYDEQGNSVYLTSIQTEKQINLSNMSAGVYFVRLENDKEASIRKFVKQ